MYNLSHRKTKQLIHKLLIYQCFMLSGKKTNNKNNITGMIHTRKRIKTKKGSRAMKGNEWKETHRKQDITKYIHKYLLYIGGSTGFALLFCNKPLNLMNIMKSNHYWNHPCMKLWCTCKLKCSSNNSNVQIWLCPLLALL